MQKLKYSEIAVIRAQLLAQQGGKCALSGITIKPGHDALDHCHTTGYVRDVLDRGVNALLGKVENNAARYGVRELSAFGQGLGRYLSKHSTPQTPYLHPTHKTADEKRLARNKAARLRRTKKGTNAG